MSASTAKVSPFTQAVVAAMRKLYVELQLKRTQLTMTTAIQKALQTRALTTLDVSASFLYWSIQKTKSIEVLLEAPYRQNHLRNSVLLTIDLTKGVADEAIARKDSVIVTYRKFPDVLILKLNFFTSFINNYQDPIIFRGLKSITLENSQQNTLLRLAQEGISVYSPHTAVDAAPGGLNDWLADIVIGERQASPYYPTTLPSTAN